MSSIFSKIVQGDIPSHKVAESNSCYAFMDIEPLRKGHVLVIPKEEVDYIFDLEDSLLSELQLFAKKVAKAIEKVVSCERIGVAVIGLEVPHAHIHLIPIKGVADINFEQPKLEVSHEELAEMAEKIRSAFEEKN